MQHMRLVVNGWSAMVRMGARFSPSTLQDALNEARVVLRPPPGLPGQMSYFHRDLIRPEILRRRKPTVVEIGVLDGRHTRLLLDACWRRAGRLIGIDPFPVGHISKVLKFHPCGRIVTATSLDALPLLVSTGTTADIVLVDGDHNYHTVERELLLIDKILAADGVIFLHDVAWPYGRRDLYYEPDRIPFQARQPYAKRGIVQGQKELAVEGGTNPELNNAVNEGGPRNGVLTAVEDLVSRDPRAWTLELYPENFGLGVLRRAVATGARRSPSDK